MAHEKQNNLVKVNILKAEASSDQDIAGLMGVRRDAGYKRIDRKQTSVHKVGRLWKFRKDHWVRAGDCGVTKENQA